jgi:hypothetical protein
MFDRQNIRHNNLSNCWVYQTSDGFAAVEAAGYFVFKKQGNEISVSEFYKFEIGDVLHARRYAGKPYNDLVNYLDWKLYKISAKSTDTLTLVHLTSVYHAAVDVSDGNVDPKLASGLVNESGLTLAELNQILTGYATTTALLNYATISSLADYQARSEKDQPGGYVGLGIDGKIALSQLQGGDGIKAFEINKAYATDDIVYYAYHLYQRKSGGTSLGSWALDRAQWVDISSHENDMGNVQGVSYFNYNGSSRRVAFTLMGSFTVNISAGLTKGEEIIFIIKQPPAGGMFFFINGNGHVINGNQTHNTNPSGVTICKVVWDGVNSQYYRLV